MSQDSAADTKIEKSYIIEGEGCGAGDKEVGNGGEDDKDSRMSLGEDKDRPSASEEEDDQEYQYQSEEEEIVISQNEFLSLQTFKNICFNIRENLDMIRSYKKEIVIFLYVFLLNIVAFLGDNFAWQERDLFIYLRRSIEWTLSY